MPGAGRVVAVLGGILLAAAGRVTAQQGPSAPASAAALQPDTVAVGAPFTLGLSVAGPGEPEVQFPPLLQLGAELEQLRPVDVRWDPAEGGRWRAHYRLAAWKAGEWQLPPVRVQVEGVDLSLSPPPVYVTSVLPAASEGPLPLEGPRGPWPLHGFPWWLLLLLLLLALLWWFLRRLRRTGEGEEPEALDPATQAREALARLRGSLEDGDVDLAAYYDGIETILRTYLAARRGWPLARPVRAFVNEADAIGRVADMEKGLRSLQARAGLVRFAHVGGAQILALADADACLAWLEAAEGEAA